MADNVHLYGFRWAQSLNGPVEPHLFPMTVADAYQGTGDGGSPNVGIRAGDVLKRVSDGTVALALTAEVPEFICMAVKPYWNGSAMTPTDYLPGATTGGGILERKSTLLVARCTAGLWECDVDDAVTATTEAAYLAFLGENVQFTCVGNTANASRPTQDPRLDISVHATTNTHGCRLEQISKNFSNQDFSGANVKMIISFNDTSTSNFAAGGGTPVGV